MKATYQLYDEHNKPAETGTFEEWWFGERQYKVAYHSPTFNQEEYRTGQGLFRVGDQGWPAWPLSRMRDEIESPVPAANSIGERSPQQLTRSFGSTQFACSALPGKNGKKVTQESESYCFDTAHLILRFSNSENLVHQTAYDQIGRFGDLFVPHSIRMLFLGVLSASVRMDALEELSPDAGQAMHLPANAQPGALRELRFPASTTIATTRTVRPAYPEAAKSARVTGTVLVIAHVGLDGHVMDAHAVAGPKELREASEAATRQWVYKPVVIDGTPVEFEIEVTHTFATSG